MLAKPTVFVTRPVTFRCDECNLNFHSAYTSRAGDTLIGLVDDCPICRGETHALACERCGTNSPDLDDLCWHCVATDYLLDPAELAADRRDHCHKSWWANVERWVAATRAEWDAETRAERIAIVESMTAEAL